MIALVNFPILEPAAWWSLTLGLTTAVAPPRIAVSVPAGVGLSAAVPMAAPWPAGRGAVDQAAAARWRLVEVTSETGPAPEAIPVQFDLGAGGDEPGGLWWLAPPARARERLFELREVGKAAPTAFRVEVDPARAAYQVIEGTTPVLRYNHGTVAVPPGVGTNYARGNYITPLHGLGGELLTDDYPKDHPHHRGLGWSWPVTRWKDEVRDLWAVAGVWARPVSMRRLEVGPVFAHLEAESVWKWGDTTDIVREVVRLRIFGRSGGARCIDVELRLIGLVDGVAIGGRPHGGYGGFGLRAQPADQRVITRFTDPPGTPTRRSWLDYSGMFKGGTGPSGLAILEDIRNPLYPSELKEYPDLNYVMPAFPGEREVPLKPGEPLMLRYRLWVHEGFATAAQLEEVWAGYAHPPTGFIQQ